MRYGLALVLVAAAALTYAVATGDEPERKPKPPPTANLWIDPSGGTCVRSDVPAIHVDARACADFTAAYAAARAGDTVNLVDARGGDDYGPQTIPVGTKAVTFRGASGRPEIGELINAGANTTLRNLVVEQRGNADSPPCPIPGEQATLVACNHRQTYERVIVDGLVPPGTDPECPANHGVMHGRNRFVFRDGVVRNVADAKAMEIGGADQVIDNVLFTGITQRNACSPEVHNECVYASYVPRFTIRNSTFVDCPTMALFFTNYADGAPYGDVTVENNVFGHTATVGGLWHDSCAMVMGDFRQPSYSGWNVRNNTFETCALGSDLPGDSRWSGNVGAWGCLRAFTYRGNAGEPCDPSDTAVAPPASTDTTVAAQGWRDPAGGDFRPTGSSPAIGAGDPQNFPPTDKDGARRGDPPGAGAYALRR